ncbi:hypothetical protein LguiB_012743 [Lonicera macranthoides]
MHSSVVDPKKPLFSSGTSESGEWKNASTKVSVDDASITDSSPIISKRVKFRFAKLKPE